MAKPPALHAYSTRCGRPCSPFKATDEAPSFHLPELPTGEELNWRLKLFLLWVDAARTLTCYGSIPGRPAARSRLSGPHTRLCISPGRPDNASQLRGQRSPAIGHRPFVVALMLQALSDVVNGRHVPGSG